ncbi:type II toxin-antitoxin system VapC family toxin [Mycobacterium sp. KBS0706]|uniref:type II toxin-antitoxin system VapC family toxin n=1 Tax=Mycobacterium sp. KBS0706 TaxID=2578109 RepID=UPI00110F8D2E|nr:type II toxin-antitoxin system VapC family toxin [Mycobacterium sp. KBS0706]TSD87478.1 type II toxin-antitoxin system VapC family toxin [Mycobacterium sp. KBS0706]
MICLDTNVVIAYWNGRSARLVERFEREIGKAPLALPVVTLFELRYGIAKSARRQENTDRLAIFLQLPIDVLTFEPEDAEEAGDIRAVLERAGTPIGPYDVLIAAQARRRGAVLVTASTGEFARVPGLWTEDWAAG